MGANFGTADFDFFVRARKCDSENHGKDGHGDEHGGDDGGDHGGGHCEDACQDACEDACLVQCNFHCDLLQDSREREACRREQKECRKTCEKACDKSCDEHCDVPRDLVYTITYQVSEAGNASVTATTTVTILHDKPGHAMIAGGPGNPSSPNALAASSDMIMTIPSILRPTTAKLTGFDNLLERESDGGLTPSPVRFDGTSIDSTQIFVGNSLGLVQVNRIQFVDANNDGYPDLVASLGKDIQRAIQQLPTAVDDPLMLFYQTSDGRCYEVPGLFASNTPVSPGGGGRVPPPIEDLTASNKRTQPGDAPRTTQLGSAFPNPSHGQLSFSVDLATQDDVQIEVFDLRGALVRTILKGNQPAGRYELSWNGLSNAGQRAPNGLYMVRMTSRTYHATRSVMLVR